MNEVEDLEEHTLEEVLEQVTTVGEAFDLMSMLYDTTSYNFHMRRQPNGWLCEVMQVEKIVNNNQTTYKENFILRKTGPKFVETFKAAVRICLK